MAFGWVIGVKFKVASEIELCASCRRGHGDLRKKWHSRNIRIRWADDTYTYLLSTYAEQGTVRLRLTTTQSTATRENSLELPGVERRKCATASIGHMETKREHCGYNL